MPSDAPMDFGYQVFFHIQLARLTTDFHRRLKFSDSKIHPIPWKVSWNPITLWLFNIAMENCPFIDGLPIRNGDFP